MLSIILVIESSEKVSDYPTGLFTVKSGSGVLITRNSHQLDIEHYHIYPLAESEWS